VLYTADCGGLKLKTDKSCIFCKIVGKQASSSIIYEDSDVLAFLDIRPLTQGHVLVIPKEHYVDVFDIPGDLLGKVQLAVKHVAAAVKEATDADGISVIQQNGKAAGQDIFHLHFHVVPRHEGEKLPSFSDLKMVEREKLDLAALKIKACLKP
jgi:histidine triad (HIT) family protein